MASLDTYHPRTFHIELSLGLNFPSHLTVLIPAAFRQLQNVGETGTVTSWSSLTSRLIRARARARVRIRVRIRVKGLIRPEVWLEASTA